MVAASTSDNNALLVSLCVKILSNVAPEGMTTKELAAELDKEISPDFEGISSSILSSKLNAVFRRSHNDSHNPTDEQLAELPLTRCQSSEVPRRLVYTYTPPKSASSKSKAPSATSAKGKGGNNTNPSDAEKSKPVNTSRPQAYNRNPKNLKVEPDTEHNTGSSDEEPNSSSDEPAEPLTPTEDSTSPLTWTSPKRRKLSIGKSTQTVQQPKKVEEQSSLPPHCPNTPPIAETTAQTKAQAFSRMQPNQPKFNLYYDLVGIEAVNSALTPTDSGSTEGEKFDLDILSEYSSPESLGLSDLDNLVC